MPLYEYTCQDCGFQEEYLETAGGTVNHTCDACGSNRMRKGFSLFAARSKNPADSGQSRASSPCSSCSTGTCATCRR